MPGSKTFASIAAFLSATSLAATPVAATEIDLPGKANQFPVASGAVLQQQASDYHRRYRRNHVDTGDVLAGVLIIGTIAAIASAASKNSGDRDTRDRDRDYRDYDNRDRDRRNDSRYDDSRGIDRAVSMCVNEIERDVRVDSVDGVQRDGNGWSVQGRLYNGERFSCEIGSDGRIGDIEIGGRDLAYAATAQDNQYSDDRYAQARARADSAASTPSDASQPAYPGGALPGEQGEGDDRYQAHEAADGA